MDPFIKQRIFSAVENSRGNFMKIKFITGRYIEIHKLGNRYYDEIKGHYEIKVSTRNLSDFFPDRIINKFTTQIEEEDADDEKYFHNYFTFRTMPELEEILDSLNNKNVTEVYVEAFNNRTGKSKKLYFYNESIRQNQTNILEELKYPSYKYLERKKFRAEIEGHPYAERQRIKESGWFSFGKKRKPTKRKVTKRKVTKKGGPPKMSANKFDKTGYHFMKGTDGKYYTITPVGETHGRNVRWRWIKATGSINKKRVYNSFGKKRIIKIPMRIKKLCRKLKIKMTVKRGSKRVYKKLSVLKKLIKKKLKRKN